ncbi:MAG: hypothetical protein WC763_01965 [Candidatus Paceibacterota bacterium]|jgi:hypothetical protein
MVTTVSFAIPVQDNVHHMVSQKVRDEFGLIKTEFYMFLSGKYPRSVTLSDKRFPERQPSEELIGPATDHLRILADLVNRTMLLRKQMPLRKMELPIGYEYEYRMTSHMLDVLHPLAQLLMRNCSVGVHVPESGIFEARFALRRGWQIVFARGINSDAAVFDMLGRKDRFSR